MPRLLIFAAIVLLTASPSATFGDDPLDSVDGTEGWEGIDTSSVDEDQAWRRWNVDLRRWEAGRIRIESERAHMNRYQQRSGREQILEEDAIPVEGEDLQTRIDGARRIIQSGGEDTRDDEGQSNDDERPWSRR